MDKSHLRKYNEHTSHAETPICCSELSQGRKTVHNETLLDQAAFWGPHVTYYSNVRLGDQKTINKMHTA